MQDYHFCLDVKSDKTLSEMVQVGVLLARLLEGEPDVTLEYVNVSRWNDDDGGDGDAVEFTPSDELMQVE